NGTNNDKRQEGGKMTTKMRAYIVMIFSLLAGIFMLASFLVYVLPDTNHQLAGWGCLIIFEGVFAIFFIVSWTTIEKINHPDISKK
ncbi:unnamed protein product, partial [marine sediment metagenome]